jgi:uncharacterized protein (TIGR03000 family)
MSRPLIPLAVLLLLVPPLVAQPAPLPGASDAAAYLTVKLPADAKLLIDDHPTKATGDTRRFVTPPLDPSKKYSYILKATFKGKDGKDVTVEEKVTITPGKTTDVDLTKSKPKTNDKPKTAVLWDRLGGEAGVKKVVDDFCELASKDSKVDVTRGGKYKLDEAKLAELKKEVVEFISANTGGTLKYTGKSMKEVHKGMAITNEQFDAAGADFKKALEKNKVKTEDADELMKILNSTRKDIVEPKKADDKSKKDDKAQEESSSRTETTAFRDDKTKTEEKPKRPLDVPFVGSRPEVVAEMIKLADVKKSDLLYDMGCGEGIIVVTAAKKTGCKAIGVDLDPEMVEAAKKNAKKEKVEDLVTIQENDIFKVDISKATVVATYLLENLNERLVPQLNKMKEGSRVVTNDYPIPGYEPVKIAKVETPGRTYKVFLYTIPLKKQEKKEKD